VVAYATSTESIANKMINALLRLFRGEKPTCDPVTQKPKPTLIGTKLCMAFSNPKRSWTEDFDLLDVLNQVLHENGHKVQRVRNGGLMTGGYLLLPELSSFTPLDDGEGSRHARSSISIILNLGAPIVSSGNTLSDIHWRKPVGSVLKNGAEPIWSHYLMRLV